MTRQISPETRRKLSAAGRRGAEAKLRNRRGQSEPTIDKDAKPGFKSARSSARLIRGQADWYEIRNNVGADKAQVYIYDEIGFFGVTATEFVNELRAIRASTIELHINSPGGDVFDGLAIYNALSQHSAQVNVFIDGLAASAASFIAMAGDNVEIARNAMLMIHDAIGLAIGNAADMREMADLLDKHSDNIADIYAQRTGGDKDEIRDLMREETWFGADEAVSAGLADDTFNDRSRRDDDDDDDAAARFDLSVFAYRGRDDAPDPPLPLGDSAGTGSDPNSGSESGVEDTLDFEAIGQTLKGAFA